MAIKNYMRDVVNGTDLPMIDALTEEAPILEMLPMQETNAGMRHVVEQLKSTDAVQLVDLDGPLPTITSDTTIEDVTMSVLGGKMVVGEDAAKRFGGKEVYFAKKLAPILKESGSQLENSLIYNTWRPYAKANSREIDAGGSTADKMFSIVAIKFEEDATNGLYDSEGFGTGKMFDILQLYGGAAADIDVGNSVTATGYAQRVKAYFGIQTANPRNIGSIVNIDLIEDGTTDTGYKALPTEKDMDDLLEHVRASAGNTLLLMHPKVKAALGVYKGGRLEMVPADDNFSRAIEGWEGIRILTSRNFSNGAEAVVA